MRGDLFQETEIVPVPLALFKPGDIGLTESAGGGGLGLRFAPSSTGETDDCAGVATTGCVEKLG
jgi:hypothetical protein